MWSTILAVALATTPAEVPRPSPPTTWVSDMANVIDPTEELAINARLSRLYADRGVQIAVVTVPTTGDLTPKQFTTELFNLWGIGDARRDDGLLVVLAVEQRRLEMEPGYGLEGALPDGWLGVMQGQRMVPHFKQGDYGQGIEAGVVAVDAKLRGEVPPAIRGGATPTPTVFAPTSFQTGALLAGILVVAGVVMLVTVLIWRRRRTCPTCEIPMEPLSEREEDAHLSDGQQAEEDAGSREWDVYECPQCSHVRSFGHRKLLSGYSSCPGCGFRTRSTSRETLQAATTYTSGSRRITETCEHCDYHNSYTRTIPARGSSSSGSGYSGGGFSSGGGGGGFGGGSSGGGGAGSSW